MATLYRIYTEDVNRDEVRRIIDAHLSLYTLITAEGIWDGKTENSLIIEYISDDSFAYQLVVTVAKFIKKLNNQDAVLVTFTPIESELV
jgi:hypothetical protein